MNFQEYQNQTHKTAVFPKDKGLEYLALGISNEAGEVAGVVKKYLRGDYSGIELEEKLIKEIGDVLWYASELCNHFGLNMGFVANNNISKLQDRMERGVIKGSGDDR